MHMKRRVGITSCDLRRQCVHQRNRRAAAGGGVTFDSIDIKQLDRTCISNDGGGWRRNHIQARLRARQRRFKFQHARDRSACIETGRDLRRR